MDTDATSEQNPGEECLLTMDDFAARANLLLQEASCLCQQVVNADDRPTKTHCDRLKAELRTLRDVIDIVLG